MEEVHKYLSENNSATITYEENNHEYKLDSKGKCGMHCGKGVALDGDIVLRVKCDNLTTFLNEFREVILFIGNRMHDYNLTPLLEHKVVDGYLYVTFMTYSNTSFTQLEILCRGDNIHNYEPTWILPVKKYDNTKSCGLIYSFTRKVELDSKSAFLMAHNDLDKYTFDMIVYRKDNFEIVDVDTVSVSTVFFSYALNLNNKKDVIRLLTPETESSTKIEIFGNFNPEDVFVAVRDRKVLPSKKKPPCIAVCAKYFGSMN